MKYFTACIISLFFIASATSARAAGRTGSFDTTIAFQGSTRVLSCYVPTDYSDTVKYRLMVCLHGLGDNSTNYRNALISSLQWNTYFPNTIFVCPEAATTTSDFDQPDSDGLIVQTCIDFARARYTIDTTNIILQGFSLGGRAALRYGLDNYKQFKGLLLNTPAIQGVKNALNQQPTYLYNYANAAHIPIYITHGETDILYEPPIDSALKAMILDDGMVRYNDVPNIGHTIPSFSQMSDAAAYFYAPAHPGKALDLFELSAPARTCTAAVTPTVLIRNIGTDTISSANLVLAVNGQKQNFTWTGSLVPFQHALVTLPTLLPMTGLNSLDVTVDSINLASDTFASEKLDTFEYVAKGVALPISESFEESTFPPPGWMLDQAGDAYSPWSPDNTVASSGTTAVGAFNTLFIFDNLGRAEGLVSPVMDLRTAPDPKLSFDLAFNYDRYTPPYVTATLDLSDTLDIQISTDCGASFTSIFRKSGAELATFAQPIINPLSIQADFIVPKDTNWRRYTLDLGQFGSAPEAMIKFDYISGLGGSIYLDSITVGTALGVESPNPVAYSLYPNPASDHVALTGEPGASLSVSVLDLAGRQVLSSHGITNGSGDFALDTHSLSAGVYLLRITNGQTAKTEQLTIVR